MIQVVHRALNILETIAKEPEREIGLSEIAEITELNPGTCANILKTLVSRNYVEQAGAKKGYKLGFMAYRLTNADNYGAELVSAASEAMNRLSDTINETVILSIIKNSKRILLNEITCNHEIQVRTTMESPVYKATTGRMLLAYYSPKELDDFIKKEGLPSGDLWPEVVTKTDLISKLNEIKNNGIEIYCNKNQVVGLATPIIKNNKAIASLGIYLPKSRFGKIEKKKIKKSLLEATALIGKKINTHQ